MCVGQIIARTDDMQLESYYYVPGIKLTGTVKYYNLKTGEVYLERQDMIFAIIDVADGSVVETPQYFE